jgi:hypothetical protein
MKGCETMKLPTGWIRDAKWSLSGERDSSTSGWQGLTIKTARGAPGFPTPRSGDEVKALTPNDFPSLAALQERILGFQQHYELIATPFEWKFTKQDLHNLLAKTQSEADNAKKVAA